MGPQVELDWTDGNLLCPVCQQPTEGAYKLWVQPCGDAVSVEWLHTALALAREKGVLRMISAPTSIELRNEE